jgi:histone H4
MYESDTDSAVGPSLQEPSSPRQAHTPAASDLTTPSGGARGKGPGKHRRKVHRDNIQGINKSSIRRLARRGGVKRMSGLIYDESPRRLKVFLETVIHDAQTYTEHAHRKTVTTMDVVYALKRHRTMYGFGG